MIDQPFTIFAPFADRFSVRFFPKSDAVAGDNDVMRLLNSDRIASLKQVHGRHIVRADTPMLRTQEGDALLTDQASLWLTIRAADCQQLVVYAPRQHVCGVIHAGWKGLKAGIIPAFFEQLKEQGITPSDTCVFTGPSLCTECAEFSDPATELAGLDPQFFHGRHVDLRGIADAQLENIGVPASQRERHPDCTKCKSEMYWSYRGGDRGEVVDGHVNMMACMLL